MLGHILRRDAVEVIHVNSRAYSLISLPAASVTGSSRSIVPTGSHGEWVAEVRFWGALGGRVTEREPLYVASKQVQRQIEGEVDRAWKSSIEDGRMSDRESDENEAWWVGGRLLWKWKSR
ncbi:hypothetical protein Tdes44962_MAKER09305 [Teratosphaeria destructans]|uniref:Uncharacterized protein n=1 Tax=Teratosphaeria destructans TaxID=418781 RepID=A0A9W7STQ2_9PEZI|nr:hypothetical protein Tdes44962_MAKER09305 [Teratosphaeria destructans]